MISAKNPTNFSGGSIKFEKYTKIKLLGNEDNEGIFYDSEDEIITEEKIDGGNFRFMLGRYGLILGSRTRELDADNPNSKTFKRCIEFVKTSIGRKKLDKNLIFYGECCISHSMQYDWEKIPPYLGFDIKSISDGKFLGYDEKVAMFEKIRLPIVPLIKRCKVSEIKEFTDESMPNTVYPAPSAKDLKVEGVVIKNYKKQLMGKYVRIAFREKNKEAFRNSKKWARQEGDDALLVATYCTNPRIEKIIFKLIDEGEKLDMPLMALLPKRVMEDIYEEYWKEIVWSNWSLNFKNIRKKINKRCLAILQQIVVNNSLAKKKWHSH